MRLLFPVSLLVLICGILIGPSAGARAGSSAPAPMEDLLKSARAGDAAAQYELGECLIRLERPGDARAWFDMAAAQGELHAEARRTLMDGDERNGSIVAGRLESLLPADARAATLAAYFAFYGCGVTRDAARAAALLEDAAGRGDLDAGKELGVLLLNGEGVERDPGRAVRCLLAAARGGHASAQFILGGCYGRGEGVDRDDAQSIRWYSLAAEQGHARAQKRLGDILSSGAGGVRPDRKRARQWYERAAAQGDREAAARLGGM